MGQDRRKRPMHRIHECHCHLGQVVGGNAKHTHQTPVAEIQGGGLRTAHGATRHGGVKNSKCRHPAMAKWQKHSLFCLRPFPPTRCSCAIALFLHGHLTTVFSCIARWQIAPQKSLHELQRLPTRRTYMRLVRLLFATAIAMAPQKKN